MTTPKPRKKSGMATATRKAASRPKAPAAPRPLTPKQEAFYRAYLATGNATEAYRQAYSASRMKPEVVNQRAHELLRHGEITVRLAAQQAKLQTKAESRYQVTKERVIAELARIAFARSADFFKWGPEGVTLVESSGLTEDQIAAVGEVSERPGMYGKTIRVKMHDKVAALEKLGRHVGAFKAESEDAVENALVPILNVMYGDGRSSRSQPAS